MCILNWRCVYIETSFICYMFELILTSKTIFLPRIVVLAVRIG